MINCEFSFRSLRAFAIFDANAAASCGIVESAGFAIRLWIAIASGTRNCNANARLGAEGGLGAILSAHVSPLSAIFSLELL